MTHTDSTYIFLGRPRRFGKSLLVTTLRSYFEGKKDLFKGLAIENLEKDWTEYPVLHFDMSGGKHMEKEQLERYLAFILENEEKKWGITHPQIDANNRLMALIDTAYKKSGKPMLPPSLYKKISRAISRDFFVSPRQDHRPYGQFPCLLKSLVTVVLGQLRVGVTSTLRYWKIAVGCLEPAVLNLLAGIARVHVDGGTHAWGNVLVHGHRSRV